ncbi:MAG TPA: group III truncated hemoglobin [Caulobacteraceae bacterium]|nr:group III truncated hemoglobin [Caulobacteraceae bacterium]
MTVASHPSSPTRIDPAAAGVTEALIRAQVRAFYGKARRDPALGPIFDRAVTDWDYHLTKMCDFWSSVLLMTGRFRGAPMAVHAALPTLRPAHFSRWLSLFEQTAHEVCPPDAAALFITRSRMIGQSLQRHIADARGEPAWMAGDIAGDGRVEGIPE